MENIAGHWHPLVRIVLQEHTVNRGFAVFVKQGNFKMNKVKVRVNYALKAATGQRQVEAAAHRAHLVQLENITGTKVARPMSVRIVPQEPLVQHVRLVVPIVQQVNFKPVLGNPVAKVVQQDNIKLQMVKRPV